MTTVPKPDFTGQYALNREASTLEGGAAAIRSAVLRFEHRDTTVNCQAEFAFDSTSVNFGIDLDWDGNTLVFNHEEHAVTMTWRYELDHSGRRLTATERIRGGGRDQDNVWIFVRCIQ